MNRDQFLQYHKNCLAKMHEITKAKNTDYGGGTDDAFFNFTRIEKFGIATTEQGFLTRMFDKFARLTSFLKNGNLQVKSESVNDTLLDLANYCILLSAYIESNVESEKKRTVEPFPYEEPCPEDSAENPKIINKVGFQL